MKARGFTLIEVLIALVILAIALTAVLKATEDNTRNSSYLYDKTLAHWVAMNIVRDVQQGLIPLTNTQQGETVLLKQTWHWQLTLLSNNEDNTITKFSVAVNKKNENNLINLTAYKENAQT